MKTKFAVEIHANGQLNNDLLKMITNHNEGTVTIDLDVIQGYCLGSKAMYPSTVICSFVAEENHTLHIIEKGKCTLTITERELHELELSPVEADLLVQEISATEFQNLNQ